jgi:hypothetical protein
MTSIIDHVLLAVQGGHTLAAADHLLVNDAWISHLSETTEKVARALLAEFNRQEAAHRGRVVHTVLRLGMNLLGQEARVLQFPVDQTAAAVETLGTVLTAMERADRATTRAIIDGILADMASVNGGDSLPGWMAGEISAQIAPLRVGAAERFLVAFGRLVESCAYTVMANRRLAKFGNDYGRGLEYLRHLGFVQVSTNPVLAAKAFDEDPTLVETFRRFVASCPDWLADPPAHGDALALRATLTALWPNLMVFRPLAIRARNLDYLVSFQLNPHLTESVTESIENAIDAYQQATVFLSEYDRWLGLPEPGKVRPCLVFKVAGSHAAARTITRELNAAGMGTNNTVVYTVAQEVRLILDALEGKARAARAGRPLSRAYETNMGGRFTSHLRETEAERIVAAAEAQAGRAAVRILLDRLADSVHLDEDARARLDRGPIGAQAQTICAYKYLKSLDQPHFLALAKAAGLDERAVRTLEAGLRMAGTLVARRVWTIFFSPANRERWTTWLQQTYQLSAEHALAVHDSLDVLPASKRMVADTLDALGYPNVCHTEFPNHARAVQRAVAQPGFNLNACRDGIAACNPPEVVERLNQLPDFVAGYELTDDLADLLVNEVGIGDAADYGRRGLAETDWPKFGPVVKTQAEFRNAYYKFVMRCVQLVVPSRDVPPNDATPVTAAERGDAIAINERGA